MTKNLYKGASPVRDRAELQRAVNGEVLGLMDGLDWDSTPQGLQHWGKVFCGVNPLSRKSRRYLNALLNEKA